MPNANPSVRCANCVNKPPRYSTPVRGYCDACGYAMTEYKNGAAAIRVDAGVMAIVELASALSERGKP